MTRVIDRSEPPLEKRMGPDDAMASSTTPTDRPEGQPEAAPGRAESLVVRAVGRLPVKVRTKMYVAFVGTVVLLVVVGILGLRVLSQSNGRVETLEALQVRATAYRALQTDAEQVRQLLALRAGGSTANAYSGGRSSSLNKAGLVTLDNAIVSRLGTLGQAADSAGLGFVPPAADLSVLVEIRQDQGQLTTVMAQILASDLAGAPSQAQRHQPDAERLANDLQALAIQLVGTAQSQTQNVVAQNRTSYADSQRLSIAVATGSIALALILGFVLSRSVIGPIQRVESRVAAIASGDFSGRVDIANRDELGALGANVNHMNDELGRLYRELETVSRHKTEFLANMSHELRTPLNAIIGFSDVLHEQMFGELNEQQLGYVQDVLDAGHHLLSLINDILDLSKVEAGRMELEIADVSLPEVMQSGLTMNAERATRSGIALGMSVDPEEIVISADERKVRQVVFNLLSNAVKFTPAGGRVDISAQLRDGFVEVAVTDTGSGIAVDDQELIFEEFQQARGAAGTRQEGTGLGLPLSRKFIELHGGRLWVESTPGHGSTFRFTLPAERKR
jgi:signal transduction histidine kinase